jgi:predicted RNase H-like nuclease (RuvC/YqgF family)
MWNYKRKSDESNVSDLNSQVRSLEKACTEYDDMLSERTNEVDDLKREINKLKDIIEKYEKGNKGIINS